MMIVMPTEKHDRILGYLIPLVNILETYPQGNRKDERKERKIRLIHLLPAFLSVFYAFIGTYLLVASRVGLELEGPFSKEETISATILNLTYFVILVLIGTILLLILVKMRKMRIINIFYLVAMFLLGIVIYELYFASLIIILNANLMDEIILLVSLILSAISAFLIFMSKNEKILLIILTLYGGLSGPLFSFMLPMWSIFAIAIVLSIYDLYSVFYGPLKVIINEIFSGNEKSGSENSDRGVPPIRGALVPIGGLNIGLGDIFFYSLLSSAAIIYPYFSLIRGFNVSLSILLGNYITLKLLERCRYLPALPIPILLGTLVQMIFMVLKV
ncbi:MAG: hypothetical protein DRJ64_01285 [Thermoprotei archaeon]|nr:MAG: hypothetical protein DRJ64_01285 [Thermoprotei archaeon]